MSNLERANHCLEALENQRAALERQVPGGGALAYYDVGRKAVRVVASKSYKTVARHQERKLTPKQRATSILIPVHETDLVCMY